MDCGRKFKEERYLSADSVFTTVSENHFNVKAKCKASMKKEIRRVEVSLDWETGLVVSSKCSCPAGKRGYCNHVMALLFELADNSLNQLIIVPEEIACTSKTRQWGIPEENGATKDPAMTKTVKKLGDKRGISCTVYDARLNESQSDLKIRALDMEAKLAEKDEKFFFAHCIDFSLSEMSNTRFGEFLVGSTLAHHLAPVHSSTITVVTNIPSSEYREYTTHSYTPLPLKILPPDHLVVPSEWGTLTEEEIEFLDEIRISEADSYQIEKDNVSQNQCKKWHEIRMRRLTSSNARKVLNRKRNFEALANQLLNPKPETELPQLVKDAFKHGIMYEPVARKQYEEYLKYNLRHDAAVRETGILVQPYLFWLAASPDGLVSDNTEAGTGLLEIKCPKTKRKSTPDDLMADESFYVSLVNGKLKREHGYYTQIQMAMRLSGAPYCDFIVYTFKVLIIVRTPFNNEYFVNVIQKLNIVYRKYMLPLLISK